MPRSLLDNFGSMILALILALVIWLVAVSERNPSVTGAYPQAIPVEVLNKPEELVISEEFDRLVSLELRAPQDTWEGLSSASFQAFVDLAGLGYGTHEVDIQVRASDPRVRILKIDPPQASIHLEGRQEKRMRVQVNILDSPPPAYHIPEPPMVIPTSIVVSGPAPLVEQVEKMEADVFLKGSKATIEREVKAVARDAKGNAVKGVQLSSPEVAVKVVVEQRLGYKEVSVKAVTKGKVAPGYWISNITVEPSTVTLRGDPEVIEELPGYVETIPIDVTDAEAALNKRVDILLPQGVSILTAGGESMRMMVRVIVEVTPILGGQTIQRKVILRGLGRGLEAIASPEQIDIILSGPVHKLQELKPEDVQAILHLTNLGTGIHKIRPDIIAPASLRVENFVPSMVEVVITAIPTPTSTPTSTPTPGPTVPVGLPPTPSPTSEPTPSPTPSPTPATAAIKRISREASLPI